MKTETDKSYIEQINHRFKQETLLISSGLIYQVISSQINPIGAVELAMHLDLSVALVRRSLQELSQDGLVVQNYQGDWELEF